MFQEPRSYPVLPQAVKNCLRQVNGVVLPKFIEDDRIRILPDIQSVQVEEGRIIPYYPCIGSLWVDAVYDAWIQLGRVESVEVTDLAIQNIKSPIWWRI